MKKSFFAGLFLTCLMFQQSFCFSTLYQLLAGSSLGALAVVTQGKNSKDKIHQDSNSTKSIISGCARSALYAVVLGNEEKLLTLAAVVTFVSLAYFQERKKEQQESFLTSFKKSWNDSLNHYRNNLKIAFLKKKL